PDLGKYCLGDVRTLEQYEYLTGIYFREQLVLPDLILDPKPCAFSEIPKSRDAWLALLYSPFSRDVTIDKSELAANDDNVDYW
ncbi:hypothetical protein R0J91_19770, partial [Micrococcus sp. SIMBA_131]